MSERQVVVVGAGPAGVSAALALKDAGLRPLVLDEAAQVGSSWRTRYDRLRLNTCRPFSHLPNRPFPRGTPMFPTRDQVIEHLERHAGEDGIEVRLGIRVDRIDRDSGAWVAQTSGGDVRAAQAVVAIGYERTPFIPDWGGRDDFNGRVLHACEYRNAEPFRGKAVLVVGPGCSGMEIAYDLAEGGAAKVWLAVRTPPNILLRTVPGGLPGDLLGVALVHLPARIGDAVARFARRGGIGDLTAYGLPIPDEGVFSRMSRLGVAPTIVDEEVIEAIRARRIEIVGAVESLDSTGARLAARLAEPLAGGTRVEPDAVICATGYRRGLEALVGHLDVLGERGVPRALGAESAAPGLRFIGYLSRPGALGYMGKEAKLAAKAIARELQSATPPRRAER